MKKILSFVIPSFIVLFTLCSCGSDHSIDANQTCIVDSTSVSTSNDESSICRNREMTIDFFFGSRTGTYSGELDAQGLPNGHGVFTSITPAGTAWTYDGEWVNGHWNGTATTTWEDGASYTGEYCNDIMYGHGVYEFETGERYDCYFNDFDIQGEGTLYYTDGSYLQGVFDGFYDAIGTYHTDGFEYEAILEDGELSYYPYNDFFSDDQRQTIYESLYKSYRYSELLEYINEYISAASPTPIDSAYKIIDCVQPIVEYENQWNVECDDFDGTYILTFSGLADISQSNAVAVSLEESGLTIKIGFRKNGWLFFDSIALSIDKEVVYRASVSNTTRNVISGSVIEEYCYCDFYDSVIEQLHSADTAILRFSNSDSKDYYDHTLSQAEKDAMYYGLLLRNSNKELSNILYQFTKRNANRSLSIFFNINDHLVLYPSGSTSKYLSSAELSLPTNIFSTPASENGLAGTVYLVKATIVEQKQEAGLDMVIADLDGHLIAVCDFVGYAAGMDNLFLQSDPNADYSLPPQGTTVLMYLTYRGYSNTLQLPVFFLGANEYCVDIIRNG